jgi:hypothetical protein
LRELAFVVDEGTGPLDVRKYATRPQKNLVFDNHPFENRNVVLYLHSVADRYVGTNVDILTEDAAPPDPSPSLQVAEEPDPRVLANLDVLVEDRAGVHEGLGHGGILAQTAPVVVARRCSYNREPSFGPRGRPCETSDGLSPPIARSAIFERP